MKTGLSLALLLLAASTVRAEEATSSAVKIKPKSSTSSTSTRSAREGGATPDTEIVDAPTTAVLDNYGYAAR